MIAEDMLPLGTVVSLKNSKEKLIIIGIESKALKDKKTYDYCGLLLPYGYLNSDDIFLFNKDKIEKIYFKGYVDQTILDYYEDIIWLKSKGEQK